MKQHRYRHANQHKRARKMTKKLKTYLGRVVRDIERKVDKPDSELAELLAKADRLLMQERKSKNKLYSIHAPEVECISKGKAHKRYEFGCKVGIVSTSRDNWIVGIGAFHGNPYDGHTLSESLEQSERIMEILIYGLINIIKLALIALGFALVYGISPPPPRAWATSWIMINRRFKPNFLPISSRDGIISPSTIHTASPVMRKQYLYLS